ncbi:PIN/TRAM domain-containing protein [Anaerovorax odorimutans]|uniref:PIN/TRAM domain-containing protein n=1 Tax=Anaerovorax odorimutans TaxID=109327 RepID=A0ABT1RK69_9FIRM|nr:PIN/TRAM domain-containing protein [Anaerovorax odorimutans]MCQ4635573.1 PIN/TRAM domain-containing protein [Anaerovorax odorimutans]
MLRKLMRVVFTIVGAIVGYGVFLLAKFLVGLSDYGDKIHLSNTQEICVVALCALIFGLIFFRLTPTLGKQSSKVADNIETDLQKISTNDIVMGTVGLIAGLVIAYLISRIYVGVLNPLVDVVLNIVTYFVLGFLGVVIATRKGSDIRTAWFASRKAGDAGGKSKGKHDATPKIFDTSVIIDGRIADIMKTGFIEGPIVIPEFVLVELRHIADSSDSLKRNRGRRGLDILNKIQSDYGIEIYNTASEKALDEIPEVDVKLLKLAQIMNGKVVTNDFNLNKVAGIKGVDVLNINELANTLKPVVLPGEEMTLFLVKEGKENNQAVAYLDDGTMIVVEEGRRYIGKTIKVLVTSVLQTAAGRMIFAKPRVK